MPDITPNHPAVKAGCQAAGQWAEGAHVADAPDPTALALHMTAACITAALPHLTAEDLRDTDAAEEIRTEGWQQGWAAGRDLDGDEDATPYLRDTPAGRALMAEAWDQGVADNERGWQHVYAGHDIDPDDPLAICQTCCTPNPYRKGTA